MTPSDLPVDGRGGYLYDQNISVPVYPAGSVNTTLDFLDQIYYYNSQTTCTYSACFGACLITVLHLIALTPPEKRSRPLFAFTATGLFFELMRLFCAIWATTRSGTASTYWTVTMSDPSNQYANISAGTTAAYFIGNLAAVAAFIAVQLCFWVQAKGIMATMPRRQYQIAIGSLIALGAIAVVWRLVEAVWADILAIKKNAVPPPSWLQNSVLGFYSASIVAWCLVFCIYVCKALVNAARVRALKGRNNAMYVVLLTGLDSMVIPIIFVILEWVNPTYFPGSEYCVVPAILVLIPFGSLWAGHVQFMEQQQSAAKRQARINGMQPLININGSNSTDEEKISGSSGPSPKPQHSRSSDDTGSLPCTPTIPVRVTNGFGNAGHSDATVVQRQPSVRSPEQSRFEEQKDDMDHV